MQFHRTISPRKAQISSVEKIKNDFLLERYERYIWDQEWFHVCTEISNIKISVLKRRVGLYSESLPYDHFVNSCSTPLNNSSLIIENLVNDTENHLRNFETALVFGTKLFLPLI